jgi:DNA polymerase III epsilon subunit-like protein
MRKIYALLDTETTFETQTVYNLGYIITNSKGYPLHTRETLFTDVLKNEVPFYGIRKADSLPNTTERITKEMAYGKMLADFEHYGVTTILAYNASFDIRVIAKDGIALDEKFEILDLWSLASQTICNQAFIKWAVKNDKMTEKGNIKTSAETVYQYISGITDFEEEHTALSDCYIELEIWRSIQRKKVKIAELANVTSPWQVVKKLREELGL